MLHIIIYENCFHSSFDYFFDKISCFQYFPYFKPFSLPTLDSSRTLRPKTLHFASSSQFWGFLRRGRFVGIGSGKKGWKKEKKGPPKLCVWVWKSGSFQFPVRPFRIAVKLPSRGGRWPGSFEWFCRNLSREKVGKIRVIESEWGAERPPKKKKVVAGVAKKVRKGEEEKSIWQHTG